MGYIKGITIEIDGETKGLDAALKKVNSTVRNLQGELKRVESLLKMNPGNADLVRQKQELLARSVSETKTKLDALRQAQKKMDAEGLDETNADYRRVQREITETTAKLKALSVEQKKFNILGSKVGQMTAKMSALGNKASEVGKKLRGITAAATLLGATAVSIGKNFDESMSKVRAVSGATGEEFIKLRDKAREMGSKTAFSASEAAEAMNYMAMAGWKTEDMLKGVEGIMNLAAASGEELATTADIVTDGLTAMGYSAKDSGRLADVMAAASSNANTNVAMMGETFKYAVSVAGAMNYSMEDLALATGLMANSGIKATQAGTSLRSIISRMAAPTGAVKKDMEKLGIEIKNADGTTRPFRDVLIDLRSSMADLSETEKTQIASTIAGKNAMSGFLAMINSSDKDFNKLANAIDNSSGAAEKMAGTMLDNFGGQVTVLISGLQELAISVSDTLTPAVRVLASCVQKLVSWFNSLSQGQKSAVVALAALGAAIGPILIVMGALLTSGQKCIEAFANLKVSFDDIKAGASKVAGGLKSLKTKFIESISSIRGQALALKTNTAAQRTNAAGIYATSAAQSKGTVITRIYTKAQMALSKVMALGPWKIAAVGIGLVVGALAIFCAANDDARKKVSGAFNKIKDTAKKVIERLPEILSSAADGISRTLPAIAKAVSSALPKIVDALSNGMPKMIKTGVDTILSFIDGISKALPKLIETGTEALLSLIDGFVKNIDSFIETGVEAVEKIAEGLEKALPKILKKAPVIIETLITAITKNAGKILASAAAIIIALASGIIKSIPTLIKAVPKIIAALIKALIATGKALIQAGAKLMRYLLNGIKSRFSAITISIANFVKTLPKKILTYLSSMKSAGTKLISNLLSGIKSKYASVKSSVSSFASSIPGKIRSGLGSLTSIGSNLIAGLWRGISNKAGWLKSQISGFVGNVKAWLKKFFGIHSPSKLMRDEIGRWIPEGVAAGITGNLGSVTSAMKGMTKTIESPSLSYGIGQTNEGLDIDALAKVLVNALSGVEMTSMLQLDGKTVAKTTAPFMQTEMNNLSKRAARKLGYV